MTDFFVCLDYLSVLVFAVSGALTASRKQLDLVGFCFIAAVTGIGGGTLRDLVLGRSPVFWVGEPQYLYVTTAAAIVVYFTAQHVESRYRALLWADAVGLSVACVVGANIALTAGAPWSVAILMGTLTATFGGLARDVICNETPLILRREIYATAAAAGAALDVALVGVGVPAPVPTVIGLLLALTIRAMALRFSIALPVYRSRGGRDYPGQ